MLFEKLLDFILYGLALRGISEEDGQRSRPLHQKLRLPLAPLLVAVPSGGSDDPPVQMYEVGLRAEVPHVNPHLCVTIREGEGKTKLHTRSTELTRYTSRFCIAVPSA